MTTVVEEKVNSTHRVEVVPVFLEPHPNADSLSVVRVYGYSCCVRSQDWVGVTRAAYVPPDSTVDTRRPEFAFLAKDAKLDGRARIKAKKLRGVVSFGLLIPAPEGANLGDDVAGALGVEHYEPPVLGDPGKSGLFLGGEVSSPPPLPFVLSKYDVEAFRRYSQEVFTPGEPVVVTEKLHGANGRFVYVDGQMYCGSRTEWKKEYPSYDHVTVDMLVEKGKTPDEATTIVDNLKAKKGRKNLWWQALDTVPSIRAFCEANPGVVLYGEVYGSVQDFKYGHKSGEVSFAAFDVLKDGAWVDYFEARHRIAKDVPWVPHLSFSDQPEGEHWGSSNPQAWYVPFDFDTICALAEGPSLVPGAGHVREGVVVKPVRERWHPSIGRAHLKVVGAGYLEKSA